MEFISVVLPTYNEAGNIVQITEAILSSLKKCGQYGEVVIVDDNSPDGTGVLADKLSRRHKNVKVVHRASKIGIGTAYVAGAKASKGDVILTMDADFSHNPKEIPALARLVLEEADIAIGSRYVPGGSIENWGPYRKLVSKSANAFARAILGIKTRDVTTGYRAFRKEVCIKLFSDVKSSGYSFLMECVFRAEKGGYKIKEHPIVFSDRANGQSKLGFKEQYKFAITVARLFFERLGLYSQT